MVKTLAVFMLAVVACQPVAAQDLKIPLAVYASAAALDLHSTHRFLQYEGITEVNPAINWLQDKPKTMLLFGAAVETTTVIVMHKLIGKQHPKIERVLLYSVAALHAGLAVRNYGLPEGNVRKGGR